MNPMLTDPLSVLVLMHADDKLMLGHVQSDWTGLGPILEEDIASSAMAQDDLSHALMLFEWLGTKHGCPADDIAFEREPDDYMCCDLVTMPDGFDWATALAKRAALAVYAMAGIDRLGTIDESDLAERCGRMMPELRLQVDHLASWITRLARAGDEARERMQAAFDRIAPLAGMLFEVPGGRLEEDDGFCCGRDEMFREWLDSMKGILDPCDLQIDVALPARDVRGGRRGMHAEHFQEQWTEMTEVRREVPGASW